MSSSNRTLGLFRRRRRNRSTGVVPFVGPAPVEQAYRVDRGGTFVVLQLSGPCGQWVAFLPPQDAVAMGQDLVTAGGDVASGLEVIRDERPQIEVVTHTGPHRP